MNRLHMLLVEDDEDHVFLVRRALRDVDGVDVTLDVATNGEEALRYLELRRQPADAGPDVAVVDLRLPKVSGFDVLRWIRGCPAFARLPVVVLSSSEHHDDSRTAAELGADDYVSKPLDGAQLRAEVQRLARRWAGGGYRVPGRPHG